MEPREEYHDPDYAGTSISIKEEPQLLAEVDRVQKIKTIIRREFSNELEARENEINVIDQRVASARHLLHRLRCVLVTRFYQEQRLQLNTSHIQDEVANQTEPRAKAEVCKLLREGQRRLHPSVRKLVGKQTVDLEEIFKHRAPRNKARKDYSAMIQSKNYTIPADTTKSLRPPEAAPVEVKKPALDEPSSSRPKKVPRHYDPKVEDVIKLDEVTRNRQKHRYRIIIGNTSKYAPPASSADKSTHKWLLYVRGDNADISRIVTAVTVHLHHSYAPHHTLHIDKPPYHISRRGWGEFPAKIELHFALPERNKPATVTHTIKLDRNYTGLQTLGAETIVDVWLYSNQEMLQYEFKEDQADAQIKQEFLEEIPAETETPVHTDITEPGDANRQVDSWLDFFNNETTELDVDEMIIKAVKKECDIENLIDSSVIQKDAIQDIVSENHIEATNKSEKLIESTAKSPKYVVKTEIKEPACDINYGVTNEALQNIPSELLNQTNSPKKRIMKYMDPTTGKIYYLEMDRKLDLSKVQEIVINSKGNTKTAKISPIKPNGLKNVRKNCKKGVSLLKPELKSLLKTDNSVLVKGKTRTKLKNSFKHIENDHCYLGNAWTKFSDDEMMPVRAVDNMEVDSVGMPLISDVSTVVDSELTVYEQLCDAVSRFSCARVAVNYLLNKIPLISDAPRDADFVRHFPFVVETENIYWRLDFAKRRNIEWSRAQLINKILTQHCHAEPKWRPKQILLFSRLHGYNPVRDEINSASESNNEVWSSWNDLEHSRKLESNMKQIFPNSSKNSLSIFKPDEFLTDPNDCLTEMIDLTEQEEDVDVVRDSPVKVKKEVVTEVDSLPVLPVDCEDDRLRFMFLERKCSDIGIELRNEDVGHGYSYSAVHAVLLSATKSFVCELLRTSLAVKLSDGQTCSDPPMPVWSSTPDDIRPSIAPGDVRAALRCDRLQAFSDCGLGRAPHTDRSKL